MDSATKDIEVQLREAILGSGISCYEIAKRAGVTNSQLSLFINHQRSLTLTSAAKIARVLGLELRPVQNGRKSKKE
jgi:plasmid maintenance system antidote protein VapI